MLAPVCPVSKRKISCVSLKFSFTARTIACFDSRFPKMAFSATGYRSPQLSNQITIRMIYELLPKYSHGHFLKAKIGSSDSRIQLCADLKRKLGVSLSRTGGRRGCTTLHLRQTDFGRGGILLRFHGRSAVSLISVVSQKTMGCEASQKADSQNPFERRQEASIVARRSRRNKIHLGVGCFDLHQGAIAPGFASVLKYDTDGRVRMSLSREGATI
jgi:hypothetical protein